MQKERSVRTETPKPATIAGKTKVPVLPNAFDIVFSLGFSLFEDFWMHLFVVQPRRHGGVH